MPSWFYYAQIYLSRVFIAQPIRETHFCVFLMCMICVYLIMKLSFCTCTLDRLSDDGARERGEDTGGRLLDVRKEKSKTKLDRVRQSLQVDVFSFILTL
jgi:hypothetical protein